MTKRIIAGPSKYDLMLALFEGKIVSFKLDGEPECKFRVQSIEREDGSNESWNIVILSNDVGWSCRYLIYFSTRTRTGCVNKAL